MVTEPQPPIDAGAAPPTSMARRVAGGAVYVGLAQGVKIATTLLSTILIARLLSPHDYGVAAMTAPVVAFLQVFQTLGLNQAMVQRPTITPAQFDAMFWMNACASAVIAGALLAISPLVGLFYHEPGAGWLCAATSGTVLLTGATLQHVALLNRNLRFKTLSGIDMVISVTTFAGTAVAAYLLRNYWALWVGPFLAAGLNVLLVWRADSWRPRLGGDFAGSHDMLRFGRHLTAGNFISFFGRNLDNVLIAKAWGSTQVGLYDRAYKLMMFPLQNISNPISRIMIPILSRMADDPERYRRVALGAIRALLLIVLPAVAVAIGTTERLVPFLLGARWASATPIFFWLSLAGLTQLLMQSLGWLFVSTGKGQAYVTWTIVNSVTSIAAFAIGLPWGAAGVAAAFCLSDVFIRTPFALWWVGRATPVRALDLYRLFFPFALNAGLIWLLGQALAPRLATLPLLMTCTLASYALCTGLQGLTASGRRDLSTSIALVSERLKALTSKARRS